MPWSVDATSGWAVPANDTEWNDFFTATGRTGWNPPAHIWLMQETSGNLADSKGTANLIPSGTPSYSVSVSGWTRKAVTFVDGSSTCGFSSTDTSLPNLSSSQGFLVITYLVKPSAAPAAVRNVISQGPALLVKALLTSTGNLRISDGSSADSVSTITGTGVIPVALQLDYTGLACNGYDSAETLTPTYSARSGQGIGIGGTSINTVNVSAAVGHLYMIQWDGADAHRTTTEVNALIADLMSPPSQTVDTTPPVITVVSPTAGATPGTAGAFSASYATAKDTEIVVDVTDLAPGVTYVAAAFRFIGGAVELAYRNGAFQGDYVAGSFKETIANGTRLHFKRSTGWPGSGTLGDVALDIDALDGSGNLASSTFLWILPTSTPAGSTYTAPAQTGSIDHVAAALARLPQQFVGKPNIAALITALVGPANPLEDALQQMLLRFSIDNGVGVQLDNIGNIVGQPRNGLTDASYKNYLRAKILTNRSDGKPGTLRKIARLILNTSNGQVVTQRQNNATCVMQIKGLQVDQGTARALIDFLSRAPGSGIRFLLETLVYPTDETFTMATAAVTSGALTAGTSTVILVNSTDGFPTSGSLTLNPGDTTTESVSYSTTFIHSSGSPAFRLTATPVNSYSSGIVVALATVTTESWGNGRWARGTEFTFPRAYPTSIEAMNATIGYGTWSAGWLCDDTSAPLQPAFGSPSLAAAGGFLGLPGALDDTDKAVSGTFTGGDVFDATGDIIVAAVVDMSTSGIVMAKGTGTPNWGLSLSGGILTFQDYDGTHIGTVSTPTALGNEWAAVIAVLDRAGNKIRVGATGLTTGTTSVSAEVDISTVGAWNSAANFQIGPASVSAAFIGADTLIATDLATNLPTALANFVASLS